MSGLAEEEFFDVESPEPGATFCVAGEASGGSVYFLCKTNPEICACGADAPYLCDFRPDGGETCDMPLCDECRVRSTPELDHCLQHSVEFQKMWRAL